ncbi:hypothetical protein [Halomontanus rarus]|uniref:hypothetical protein n=1 Tax=Halomontanus rarus TaxID=3034020 RepID=UPI001A983F7A
MATRRSILGITAASLTMGMGGCSTSGASPPTIRLGEFTVANYCYEPHTIHLLVEKSGEEVYREVIEIDAAPADPEESIDLTYIVPSQPPQEAGKYRIYARLDGDDEWDEADGISPDLECVEMEFQIKCGQMGSSSSSSSGPSLTMMGAVLNPNCPQNE